ncbi:MAG: VWA domain-containing protein [Planctomycetes bacterium]|nr:VWA domain-containing protein [Planctomycetota bacterium]
MNEFFHRVTGWTLLDPPALLLALLLAVALLVRRMRRAPALRFAPAAFLGEDGGLPRTWRTRLAGVPLLLQVLGVCFAILALARPMASVPLPRTAEGIDILLCLDTSSSMTALDMDPRRTRLEVAREAAARFLLGRPDDRIGLIAFARYPDLLCPLTLDHDALAALLAEVRPVPSESQEDATGIGTAVARAAQVLRAGSARSKVVILWTDGEENVATAAAPGEIAPLHAAQLCRELGIRVYGIAAGIGSRDAAGNVRPADPSQLRQLAERSGGRFFAARDAESVAGVYAALHDLEKVGLAEPRHRLEERFAPFLVLALVLILLGRVLHCTAWEVVP